MTAPGMPPATVRSRICTAIRSPALAYGLRSMRRSLSRRLDDARRRDLRACHGLHEAGKRVNVAMPKPLDQIVVCLDRLGVLRLVVLRGRRRLSLRSLVLWPHRSPPDLLDP